VTLLIPEFLQTKTYSAQRLRSVFLDMPLSEGVGPAGSLGVAQRSAGANMSVDVSAGGGFVKGDTTARQGLYHAYNDAVLNLTIGANAAGNPRVDQIILRVNDTIDGAGGADNAAVEVLAGTATSGATLDNRSGAAALPATAIRLADVLVANGAASITSSNIRDRRLIAAGGLRKLFYTGAPQSTSTSLVQINSSLAVSLEVSGDWPLEFGFTGNAFNASASARAAFYMYYKFDSTSFAAIPNTPEHNHWSPSTTLGSGFNMHRIVDPLGAGRVTISPYWIMSAANTEQLSSNSLLWVRELVGESLN
jgi:hypothetical protein